MTEPQSCELYLISPPAIEPDFADILRAALDGGEVAAFQLRLKGLSDDEIARLAEPLQRICAERDVAFIMNDSIALAKRLGTDGVHLGQGDGSWRGGRRLCRFRRFLPHYHQGHGASSRTGNPDLVVDGVRTALRGDWRDHGGECRAPCRGGCRLPRRQQRGLGASEGTGRGSRCLREDTELATSIYPLVASSALFL